MFMSLWNSFFISGRVRYKFASFWNRNHTLKALQRAVNNYHAMLEVEKKVCLHFLLINFYVYMLVLHCMLYSIFAG